MNIKEALEFGREFLSLHVSNPQKEASLLMGALLGVDRTWLIVHDEDSFSKVKEYKGYLQRRVNHEPLEYITQKASFYSHDFMVQEGVLIPRPETEILVDVALSVMGKYEAPRVLEIGVGSGIIAITLALLNPNVKITATDISIRALEVAYENAVHFNVANKIKFTLASFDEGVEGEFDMLVSNPPYIPQNTPLEEHVLHEPHLALFGGEKGHEILEELVKVTKRRGILYLACEMGYNQKFIMEKILVQEGAKEYRFYKDLAGLDRGFLAKI